MVKIACCCFAPGAKFAVEIFVPVLRGSQKCALQVHPTSSTTPHTGEIPITTIRNLTWCWSWVAQHLVVVAEAGTRQQVHLRTFQQICVGTGVLYPGAPVSTNPQTWALFVG